tara:strand:+ start:32044 stop:32256 length:213 start_codon:yes stop_codon:yes gene_type:complete
MMLVAATIFSAAFVCSPNETQRFLPAKIVTTTVSNGKFWNYLAYEITVLMRRAGSSLEAGNSYDSNDFQM